MTFTEVVRAGTWRCLGDRQQGPQRSGGPWNWDPTNWSLYLDLADLAAEDGDFAAAADLVRRGLEHEQQDVTLRAAGVAYPARAEGCVTHLDLLLEPAPQMPHAGYRNGLIEYAVAGPGMPADRIAAARRHRGPLDRLEGRFGPNAYDFEGLSLPACALFAFGVGTLVGVLVHRTLAAMAITIGAFLAVRVPVETWLRPHLLPPVQVATVAGQPHDGTRGDWTLSSGLTDSHGTRLSDTAEAAVLRTARAAGGPQENYLTAHGYGHWALIQPANRFWHFQLLEGGLYMILAIGCLTAAVLILRRRPR